MSAPRQPVPVGFHLCAIAVLMVCFGVAIVLTVGVASEGSPVCARSLMLLLCMGVATLECLSKARPSSFAAGMTLLAGAVATAGVAIAAEPSSWRPVLALLAVTTGMCLPILFYLRNQRRAHSGVRIPAPPRTRP
jgi:hypothetical protein